MKRLSFFSFFMPIAFKILVIFMLYNKVPLPNLFIQAIISKNRDEYEIIRLQKLEYKKDTQRDRNYGLDGLGYQ